MRRTNVYQKGLCRRLAMQRNCCPTTVAACLRPTAFCSPACLHAHPKTLTPNTPACGNIGSLHRFIIYPEHGLEQTLCSSYDIGNTERSGKCS